MKTNTNQEMQDKTMMEFIDDFIFGLIAESGMDTTHRQAVLSVHQSMHALVMARIDLMIFTKLNAKQREFYRDMLENNAPADEVIKFIEENVENFSENLFEVLEDFRKDYSTANARNN